jgi:hypothetical protein
VPSHTPERAAAPYGEPVGTVLRPGPIEYQREATGR